MSIPAHGPDIPIRFFEVEVLAGGVTILNRVSVSIGAGAPTVLIGANGSGKTTFPRAVMGLIPPSRGSITWGGRETARPTRRAILFQRPVMLRRSVAGNVGYALAVASVPRDQRERRTDELLSLVGLAGLQDRPARRLSGGEQQRLALRVLWRGTRPCYSSMSRPPTLILPPQKRLSTSFRRSAPGELRS